MKRPSGFTLIEAMVTVALLGIVTVGLLQAGTSAWLRANERLQQERATQVLEFEAEALSNGVAANPEAERALLAALPDAHLERTKQGRTTTIRVTWGRAPSTRELTVFTKGAP